MKVLIVSDTHKSNEDYFAVVEKEKPDMVIHCGDIEGSEYALTEGVPCPVYMVRGNCDSAAAGTPLEQVVDLGPCKAFVAHGHTYFVYRGTENLKRMALENGATFAFYGHTHEPAIDAEGPVIAINPGSISYPRQMGREASYCILTISDNKEYRYEIKYLRR